MYLKNNLLFSKRLAISATHLLIKIGMKIVRLLSDWGITWIILISDSTMFENQVSTCLHIASRSLIVHGSNAQIPRIFDDLNILLSYRLILPLNTFLAHVYFEIATINFLRVFAEIPWRTLFLICIDQKWRICIAHIFLILFYNESKILLLSSFTMKALWWLLLVRRYRSSSDDLTLSWMMKILSEVLEFLTVVYLMLVLGRNRWIILWAYQFWINFGFSWTTLLLNLYSCWCFTTLIAALLLV
jgi:hypothetical protein